MTMRLTRSPIIDPRELEAKVKEMYRAVADDPRGSYHFELGRGLAQRLGYPAETLDVIPVPAVDSFAGVGYFFDLARLEPGEHVLDLGSGSGMDVFFAEHLVGPSGSVTGIDMTPAQLAKSQSLIEGDAHAKVRFLPGYIENLPFGDSEFDVVISNGVINLSASKGRVFAEAARVLRPGGRLAIADIIAEVELPPNVVCNTDLWASCIGGAAQQDAYQEAIEDAGIRLELMKRNDYRFLSQQALDASDRYRVKSVSMLGRKVLSPS
jgi:ubiquinone/menaquinone biosynthesis C-methylase UbiE